MRTAPLALALAACGPQAPGEVPVTDAELTEWTAAGEYLRWTREPAVHPSDGPHFGGVLVYINEELQSSLKDRGTGTHVLGAAAVKELYGSGDAVEGWAVMVKIDEGDGGNTWYWWERCQDETLADGVGVKVCTGCHGNGDDHVLTVTE